jgi:hypothetical protein
LTPYKEEHVEACRSGGAKEAQQWTEGSETGAEKIGRNCKKTQKKNTETDRKVIQQNTKQKLEWRRQGMRKRDGGTGSRDIK